MFIGNRKVQECEIQATKNMQQHKPDTNTHGGKDTCTTVSVYSIIAPQWRDRYILYMQPIEM